MKILVIGPFPPSKIAEADYALHLCERLAGRGVEVDVITTQGAESPDVPGLTVYPFMRDWSWTDLQRLLERIKACSPDAILLLYLHLLYATHPMIRFLPTLAKAMLPGRPFVTLFTNAYTFNPFDFPTFRIHIKRNGVPESIGPADLEYQYGSLLRDSDRIIVLSGPIQSSLSPYWPMLASKTLLLPPPPILLLSPEDDGQVRHQRRRQLGVGDDDFLIAYFGYLYPSKGVETLILAFQRISNRHQQARLLLIGGSLKLSNFPTYAEEVLALPRQLALDGKVLWTGPYPWDSDEGSRYLRAADVCVLPFDEGIALNNSSLAGAVAHGLPIITTRGRDLETAFVHRENVYLCPPKVPQALAAAIEQVMEDAELYQQLQAGARQLSREWYSWERNLETLLGAFKGACATPDLRTLEFNWKAGI